MTPQIAFSIGFVSIGILLFTLVGLQIPRYINLLSGTRYLLSWKVLFGLIGFFYLGYFHYLLTLIFLGNPDLFPSKIKDVLWSPVKFSTLFISVVYCFGALFVFIVTKLCCLSLMELKNLQEKMIRTEKLATIGQLASGVGHELRNPLGAIKNALYYFKDAIKESPIIKEDPTFMEFIDIAEKEMEASEKIVGDLLEYSRVIVLNAAPTDVNQLLSVVGTVCPIPQNVKLQKDLAGDLPRIVIDARRMRQVIINITLNAVQAMPEGGELSITTRLEKNCPDFGSSLVIAFKDTGVGVPPENISKIFDPLFTTKAQGTGLGLAICHGIVAKHGGKILVASWPGQGSAFSVKIPLASTSKA